MEKTVAKVIRFSKEGSGVQCCKMRSPLIHMRIFSAAVTQRLGGELSGQRQEERLDSQGCEAESRDIDCLLSCVGLKQAGKLQSWQERASWASTAGPPEVALGEVGDGVTMTSIPPSFLHASLRTPSLCPCLPAYGPRLSSTRRRWRSRVQLLSTPITQRNANNKLNDYGHRAEMETERK